MKTKKSKKRSTEEVKSKGNLKSKKNKGKKDKTKKTPKDRGLPELIAVTKEKDGDTTYLSVHPIDFSDINEDSSVGIYKLRRVSNVQVSRKIKRVPKE